jgi:hypothetical protein
MCGQIFTRIGFLEVVEKALEDLKKGRLIKYAGSS